MNVLVVNTSTIHGGAAAIAMGLFNYVRSKPDIRGLFVADRAGQQDGVVPLSKTKISFMLNVLMFRLFSKDGVLNNRMWRRILKQQLDWADVVHLHNVHGYYLPLTVLKIILKKPTVWTLHDYWLFTGRCASIRGCKDVISGCARCKFTNNYPAAWFDRAGATYDERRKLIADSDAIFVAPSRTSRDCMINLGMPSNRIQVIENPILEVVDIGKIKEKQAIKGLLFLPANKKIAVFVSNIVEDPGKGYAVLESAIRQLQSTSWYFVIIGRPPKRISSFPLGNVSYIGHVYDRRLLAQYLVAADLMVNPSYNETFGLVNIEALSCGCPVVCSDLPVFRELDLGGMTFFQPGNFKQLSELLVFFETETMTLQNRLSIASAIRSHYSLDRSAEKYIKLYETISNRNYNKIIS